jgi:hypothetical protein
MRIYTKTNIINFNGGIYIMKSRFTTKSIDRMSKIIVNEIENNEDFNYLENLIKSKSTVAINVINHIDLIYGKNPKHIMLMTNDKEVFLLNHHAFRNESIQIIKNIFSNSNLNKIVFNIEEFDYLINEPNFFTDKSIYNIKKAIEILNNNSLNNKSQLVKNWLDIIPKSNSLSVVDVIMETLQYFKYILFNTEAMFPLKILLDIYITKNNESIPLS